MFGLLTIGGERGIRTLATCYSTTPLAGEPLRPLEYLSTFDYLSLSNIKEKVKVFIYLFLLFYAKYSKYNMIKFKSTTILMFAL